MANPNGIVKYFENGGYPMAVCQDCKQCEYVSKGRIKHSGRCDFPQAQWEPEAAETTTTAAESNVSADLRTGDGLTGEELIEAIHKGYLSTSKAMNTDF